MAGYYRDPFIRFPASPDSVKIHRLSLIVLLAAAAACENSPTEPGGANGGGGLSGRFTTLGRGPVTETHTSDLWVFRGVDGRDYAYLGTWGGCGDCFGDRMYAWDVSDPSNPQLTDSLMVDARVVNDVKVNAAGTVAVITREGASDRKNGIVILDLTDPAHPAISNVYTENLTGGVHNTFIDGSLVYAVHNGTGRVHVIDISTPSDPKTLSMWGLPSSGRLLHDVWVKDGLAYLSYWDDGLVILDVGAGIAGGSPTDPQMVSQLTYTTQVGGITYGNTHVALPYTNRAGRSYVFVGDEIFPPTFDIRNRNTQPGGYVHVIDVTDPGSPVEVAKYEVPGAGAHNLWAEDDILYVAYYNAGLHAVDISGELEGDLLGGGRQIAVLGTTDDQAYIPLRTFTWGPQVHDGLVYASDHNSGLWIARLDLN